MDKAQDISIRSGRILFAIAFFAFGIEQCIFSDFIAGFILPLSPDIPGRLVWSILSGLVLILAAAVIIIPKRPRLVIALAGLSILIWPGLRHLALLVSQPSSGGAWVWFGKSLALSGCAFIVAASYPEEMRPAGGFPRFVQFLNRLLPAGPAFIGIFMIICGIFHFLYGPGVATLVPDWIPGPLFWTYFAAVALVAGGAGLIFNIKKRLAALLSCIMIFIWALILHAPRVASLRTGNETTSLFQTFALSGALLVLSRILTKKD
jgi:uncharacterized membrane protein